MKEYIKPSFEFVELRIEERLARCCNDPMPPNSNGNCRSNSNGHGLALPGNHPGCVYHCPHS